ncbi:hypothetical protein NGRA_1271 [Nosema granulosis]|uniref:Uncharacterized protein n=1 Tax=Nosema granulosis TaxID=83296 RepID=A0A9P6H232_9MICR|nr:hypothetical protein NGRA_1271 [Nosema granulosis]
MVVQAKNTTPRYSSLNSPKPQDLGASELLKYYGITCTLRKIPMETINFTLKPVLCFVMIFGSTIFGMYCIEEVSKKNLDIFHVILKTVVVNLVCVGYGLGTGLYFKWLLSKPTDTSQGSYIYVCLLSLLFSPIFLLLSFFFWGGSWLFNLFNAILSTYILQINLTSNHTFVDSRAQFIYKFIETVVVFVFLLLILPYAAA